MSGGQGAGSVRSPTLRGRPVGGGRHPLPFRLHSPDTGQDLRPGARPRKASESGGRLPNPGQTTAVWVPGGSSAASPEVQFQSHPGPSNALPTCLTHTVLKRVEISTAVPNPKPDRWPHCPRARPPGHFPAVTSDGGGDTRSPRSPARPRARTHLCSLTSHRVSSPQSQKVH